MKVFAVVVSVVMIFTKCYKADVCSYDALTAYINSQFSTNPICLSSLSSYFNGNKSLSTLFGTCNDACGGAVYRWYRNNCIGNTSTAYSGIFNASTMSDVCSQNAAGQYCAQAAANFNPAVVGQCITLPGTNCSANCTTLLQQSLTSLGCCYNTTSIYQALASGAFIFQACGAKAVGGTCVEPFSTTTVTGEAAAVRVAKIALAFYVALAGIRLN